MVFVGICYWNPQDFNLIPRLTQPTPGLGTFKKKNFIHSLHTIHKFKYRLLASPYRPPARRNSRCKFSLVNLCHLYAGVKLILQPAHTLRKPSSPRRAWNYSDFTNLCFPSECGLPDFCRSNGNT